MNPTTTMASIRQFFRNVNEATTIRKQGLITFACYAFYFIGKIVAGYFNYRHFKPIYGDTYIGHYLISMSAAVFCGMFRASFKESMSFFLLLGKWIISVLIGIGLAFLFQPPISPNEAARMARIHPQLEESKSLWITSEKIRKLPPDARKTFLYPQPYHFYAEDDTSYIAFVTVDVQTGRVAYYKLPPDTTSSFDSEYDEHYSVLPSPPPFD